jgi:hypothetical protein
MVRVRAIVRRRKYFSIAPDEIAAQGAVHPYMHNMYMCVRLAGGWSLPA